MKVPAILGLDEWEAVAVPMLAKLAASAAEDVERHRTNAVPLKHERLAPVVNGQRTHLPDPNRSQAAVPKRPPMPPTVTR